MGVVRRFAVARLDTASAKPQQHRRLAIGVIDESGQVKAAAARWREAALQGFPGKVASEINTVYLAYVRVGAKHTLICPRVYKIDQKGCSQAWQTASPTSHSERSPC
jgi:nitrate reductase alpha subunit